MLLILLIFVVVVGEQLWISRRERNKKIANEEMKKHVDETYPV